MRMPEWRRLQPVLRANETAAPPASVAEAAPAWVVSVLSHSPQRPERHREKPGIEEQHNTKSGELEAGVRPDANSSWILLV